MYTSQFCFFTFCNGQSQNVSLTKELFAQKSYLALIFRINTPTYSKARIALLMNSNIIISKVSIILQQHVFTTHIYSEEHDCWLCNLF